MGADVKRIMRRWEDMKSKRMQREGEWEDIANYFMPRKGFMIPSTPTELVRRRVTTSLGPRVLSRGAALAMAYLIDPTRPFVGPNVDQGMVQAGRTLSLDSASRDYLDTLQWGMFDKMMRPKSGYLGSTSTVCVELFGFGTGIRWTGRKRGFGPKYQARPLRACWIAVNEDGEVDTLYFRFTLPVWRAVERYPELLKCTAISDLAADDKKAMQPLELLHGVEPRLGGVAGAVATNKPFVEFCLATKHNHIAEEGGYESFPYSVTRLNVEEGSDYGTGFAWQALPDVIAYNWLQQTTEMAVGLRVLPPTISPARMFPKPLDRRMGANNKYDQAGLGFQAAKDAIQKLDLAGDPSIGGQYMERIARDVEQIFFVDWMSLNDGVQKTATEIMDRRDLRIRSMTAIIPSVDRDLIGRDADRTLEIMIAEGQLPPPPESLSNAEVEWDFKGPLALLAQSGQVEAIGKLFQMTQMAAGISPQEAPATIAVSEGLRAVAEALGIPPAVVRGREEYDAIIAKANERAEAQADAADATAAATALRDGGQGLATLQDGNGGGRPAMAA